MNLKQIIALIILFITCAACQQGGHQAQFTQAAAHHSYSQPEYIAPKPSVTTLLGEYLTLKLEKNLSPSDFFYYNKASQYSLENTHDNSKTSWQNPETGNNGEITPLATNQEQSGQYCREYMQTITAGTKTEQSYELACRNGEALWTTQ